MLSLRTTTSDRGDRGRLLHRPADPESTRGYADATSPALPLLQQAHQQRPRRARCLLKARSPGRSSEGPSGAVSQRSNSRCSQVWSRSFHPPASRQPTAETLPLLRQGSHGPRTVASGVTGPCVHAVSRGCFHAAPIARPGAATGVGDRINTHVRRSRRQARRSASALLWMAQGHSRRP
jgi:hypothetical protein